MRCDAALEIRPSPVLSDEPKIALFAARSGGVVGHGADFDPARACIKAAAEALERACMRAPADADLLEARFGEIEGQLDPCAFAGARECSLLRETPRLWVEAAELGAARRALLPAEMAYLDAARRTEAPIRLESISSGAALGEEGTRQADFRGLCELIERDAFLAVWAGETPVRRIRAPFGALEGLLEPLRRYRLETRLFDLGAELGPPAVLALTLDRSGAGPAATAGIAARGSYEEAARSALLESVVCRRGIRVAMAKGTWPAPGSAEAIDSIETRAAFWTPLASLELLPRWTVDAPEVSFAALEGVRCDLDRALAELARRGLTAYGCELTSPAVAAEGFQVARVVVPALCPLHIAERAAAEWSWRGQRRRDPAVPPHPFV